MNSTQLASLKSEITNDPQSLGYGPLVSSGQLGAVCNLINGMTQSMVQSRFVNERTVLAEISDAAAILDALNLSTNSTLKYAMKFMATDSGIDIGHPGTRAILDQISSGATPVISPAQASELKAMANLPASRAQVVGLPAVTVEDIHESGVI